MKNLVIVLIVLLSFSACKKEEAQLPILIRVENLTPTTLEDIRVISYTESEPFTLEKNYGALDPSRMSEYLSHSIVRSVVDYKYKLSGSEQDLSAWCGTGSSYLQYGKYTLQIRQDSFGNIYQEIRKD